jgi:hypothetical protein
MRNGTFQVAYSAVLTEEIHDRNKRVGRLSKNVKTKDALSAKMKLTVNLSLCLIKHHAMKTYGRVEV